MYLHFARAAGEGLTLAESRWAETGKGDFGGRGDGRASKNEVRGEGSTRIKKQGLDLIKLRRNLKIWKMDILV